MSKKYIFIVLLFLVFPISVSAFHGEMWDCPKFQEHLNLTDTQKAELHKALIDNKKAMIDLEAKHQKLKIDFEELLKNENPNKEEAASIIQQIAETKKAEVENRLNFKFHAISLLTKEQKDTLFKFMAKKGLHKFKMRPFQDEMKSFNPMKGMMKNKMMKNKWKNKMMKNKMKKHHSKNR